MDPEQRKYILENLDRKSTVEIAKALGLKERTVKRFLEKRKEKGGQIAPGKPSRPSFKKKTVFLSVVLVIFLGCMAYGNSLKGAFLWDDEALVEENAYITSSSYLKQIFTQDVGKGSGNTYHFYRPLQTITYLMDHALWKLDPRGYHGTNLIIHILAALGIYFLVNALFGDGLLSLLTAGLFVIHPIHTEAVTYISGRADPLALLFVLACFLFYLKSLSANNPRPYILMLLSYTLALLSRENSLILPVLLLLYHFSFKKKIKTKEFLSIVALAGAYILLRVTVLKDILAGSIPTTTVAQRLPGFFVAIASYLRLLFLPFDLHMEYGSRLFRFGDIGAIAGIGILLAAAIYMMKKKNADPAIFFGMAWFFSALLPVSNIYPINAYMSEHWLYLPSVGFFLVVARLISLLGKTEKFRVFAFIFVLGLLVFYSYLTVKQNAVWREPISFFERTLKYAPDSWKAHYSLGNEYKDVNRIEEAIAAYQRAIRIKPDYANAHNNLGNVYAMIGKNDEAVRSYEKAIAIDSGYANAYNNLGIVYAEMGRKEDSVGSFQRAIGIKPDYAEAYYNLGNVYGSLNKKEEALQAYKKAVEIDPHDAQAYLKLGNVYAAEDRRNEAVASYRRAIAIKRDYASAYNNLGNIYVKMDETDQAVSSYQRAIEINPGYLEAHINLGNVYKSSRRDEEAIDSYKKAVEISPDYGPAYIHLAAMYLKTRQYPLAIEYCDKAQERGLISPDLLEALAPYRGEGKN